MPEPLDQLGRGLRDLRLSVIDRCNLRCTYCMPKEVYGQDFAFMPTGWLLSFDDIERVVTAFLELGVEKIRLTGGEPLLRPKLPELVRRLRALSSTLDIAMTTNGTRLATHAEALAAAGLNRLNISMDALDADVSEAMAGRRLDVERIEAGIRRTQSIGMPVKLNAVIKRGVNECQIVPLAAFARRHGLVLRYIEYMDVGNSNGWHREDVVSGAEVLARLRQHFPLVRSTHREGSEIAFLYRYEDSDSHVGFINSVSQPFCQGCNRARVSAEGKLYTCLFASEGIDLKPWLKQDDRALRDYLGETWRERRDRYSEERFGQKDAPTLPKREMWSLGG